MLFYERMHNTEQFGHFLNFVKHKAACLRIAFHDIDKALGPWLESPENIWLKQVDYNGVVVLRLEPRGLASSARSKKKEALFIWRYTSLYGFHGAYSSIIRGWKSTESAIANGTFWRNLPFAMALLRQPGTVPDSSSTMRLKTPRPASKGSSMQSRPSRIPTRPRRTTAAFQGARHTQRHSTTSASWRSPNPSPM